MSKVCSKCSETKSLDNFIKRSAMCKDCKREYDRDYRAKNRKYIKKRKAEYNANHREQRKEYCAKDKENIDNVRRDYRAKHSEKIKERSKNYKIKRKYGLSLEDIQQILIEQDNCCKICLVDFSSKVKHCVDHCHETNKVRGLLCNLCNCMLGVFKENTTIIQSSIQYLRVV